MLQETMAEDQLTSATSTNSHKSGQDIEAEPEKKHVQSKTVELEITEPVVPRATPTTRSS